MNNWNRKNAYDPNSHTHNNKSTLDKIGESGSSLTFNGAILGSTSGGTAKIPFKTAYLVQPNVIEINTSTKKVTLEQFFHLKYGDNENYYSYQNASSKLVLDFTGYAEEIMLYLNNTSKTFKICDNYTHKPTDLADDLYLITTFKNDGSIVSLNQFGIRVISSASLKNDIVEWTSLGDSLTSEGKWQNRVITNLGQNIKLNNMGVFNTCMATKGAVADYMCERINNMTPTTKLLTIFGGSNDATNNVPIGSFNTLDKTTFIGAYEVCIRKALEINPAVRIILVVPSRRYSSNVEVSTMLPICQAVKDIAKTYGLPYVDLYDTLGVNNYDLSTYLYDGTHYTDWAYDVVARKMTAAIKNFY
jgi:lysophospholipase L1-like esterase